MCVLCLTICVDVIRSTTSVHVSLIVCSSVLPSVCLSACLCQCTYMSLHPSICTSVFFVYVLGSMRQIPSALGELQQQQLSIRPSTHTTTWLYNVYCSLVQLASRCLKNCLTQSHIASFCLAFLTHMTKFDSSFVFFVVSYSLLTFYMVLPPTIRPPPPSLLCISFSSFLPPSLPPSLSSSLLAFLPPRLPFSILPSNLPSFTHSSLIPFIPSPFLPSFPSLLPPLLPTFSASLLHFFPSQLPPFSSPSVLPSFP